jgi:RNA polymerase sigma factor (sigma-70 family)
MNKNSKTRLTKEQKKQQELATKLYMDNKVVQKTVEYSYNKYWNLCAQKHITKDDLESEADERLCELVKKYDDSKKESFSAYLTKSLNGYLLNFCKKKEQDDNFDDHFEIGFDLIDENEHEQQEEKRKKVDALLSILPEKSRKIVCMKFGIDTPEMKNKDIAREMKLAEGTVRLILKKALSEMYFSNVA